MIEAKLFDRCSHPARFKSIEALRWFTGRNIAKRASPGTDLAHNHHCRVALRPAFAYVGASRLFADCHQTIFAHDIPGFLIAFAGGRFDANPAGLFGLGIIGTIGFFRVSYLRY